MWGVKEIPETPPALEELTDVLKRQDVYEGVRFRGKGEPFSGKNEGFRPERSMASRRGGVGCLEEKPQMSLPVRTGLHLAVRLLSELLCCGRAPARHLEIRSCVMWLLGFAPSGTRAGRASAGCLARRRPAIPQAGPRLQGGTGSPPS